MDFLRKICLPGPARPNQQNQFNSDLTKHEFASPCEPLLQISGRGGLATVWTSLPPFHLISNLSSLELYSFDGTQRRKLGKGFREWFANSCVCSVSWVGLAAKP